MPRTAPRILLVGAYERDNFGDLLFLLQTEQYLPPDFEVVAASPFAADMSALLDRHVPAYGPLLESEQYDHIWTVGGEVGGADLRHAYRIAATPEQREQWQISDEAAKAEIIRQACGETPIDSPYMPRPAAYPLNSSASLTLNSVGFAGVGNLPDDRQQMVLDISRAADRIAVRDNRSAQWLTEHGIAHTVAPDLVHTIGRTRPRTAPRDDSLALVQVSKPEIERRGVEAYAAALAGSTHLAGYTIRFFLAGTAPGHDSIEVYERLREEILAIDPDRRIEISSRRRPYDLVDEIASAGLWIGLSLHGRIISGAYGIPRVSFTKRKVDAYAGTWDDDMPWGITPDRLDDALAEALSPARQHAAAVGDDLADAAEANIRAAVAQLADTDPDRVRRRLESVEAWRRWLVHERAREQARVRELTRERDALAAAVPYVEDVRRVAHRGLRGAVRRVRPKRGDT